MGKKKKKTEPEQLELDLSSDMYRVSQSKVKTFRKCHQAYHLKYVEKLRRKRKTRPLVFGSLIHQMIEEDANNRDPFLVLEKLDPSQAKLFASEKAEYGEIIQDVSDIMTEYFNHWDEKSTMEYQEISGKSAEHMFEIEILPGIVWNGKIDAIGESKGLRLLVEHKSFKRRPTDDDRWRNLQSVSYFRAIEMLGWQPVDGTCWDYVWSKPPMIPGLLSGGGMSQKKMDTLPVTVRRAVKQYGLNVKDYRDYIKSTEANRSNWFYRVVTPVDKAVADEVFGDFVDTVKRMADGHGKLRDRNIERHCSWCDFEPLCRARLQGLDYDYIKEREYEVDKADRGESEQVHSVSNEDIE